MPVFRLRSLASRALLAAFALWLPAATGQGGRATCVAAASYAKSLTERPHLSCHGERGMKKRCCCNEGQTIRAAACGCHDGQNLYPTAAHDPTIPSWSVLARLAATLRGDRAAAPRSPAGRVADAPDPPPPRPFVSARA